MRGATSQITHTVSGERNFNPRTREGCDFPLMMVFQGYIIFQSTHPRGVRLSIASRSGRAIRFQSTHPRGVRPDKVIVEAPQTVISIHAPARGATRRVRRPAYDRRISIHAPARGATQRQRDGHRGDRISIHAPARGATPASAAFSGDSLRFQSTHPRGVRRNGNETGIAAIAFQSTHPRGVRPRALHGRRAMDAISIHAPARGATNFKLSEYQRLVISIHAPARGATGRACNGYDLRGISIHAPARGATNVHAVLVVEVTISIHAPARGATRRLVEWAERCYYFNPRTREGCDLVRRGVDGVHRHFNPRTREGCDKPMGAASKRWKNFNPRTREGCDLVLPMAG